MILAKFAYVRSPALLKACREIACQVCGTSDGTVAAAHSNESRHGKGRSIKASDVFVAALCYLCHVKVDCDPYLTREARQRMWGEAHRRTVALLVRHGAWPAGVEPPDQEPF